MAEVPNLKLTLVRGLPGAGKTSWSKKQVLDTRDTIRVNKDNLREMIHASRYLPQNEQSIVFLEMCIAEYYLTVENQNVIVDDTNLNPKMLAAWEDFVQKMQFKGMTGLKMQIHDVETDVYTCVERDYERGQKGGVSVGRHVIYQMAMQYGKIDPEIHYILCDIDGTLANLEHRRHYVREGKKDWKGFFGEMDNDTLREEIWKQVDDTAMAAREQGKKVYVFLVSARPETYRKTTEAWLDRMGIKDYTALFMRREGDSRDDSIVKREILNAYFKDKSKIIKVFDDRPRVIRMWREEGLEVVDVGDGVEF